MHFLHFNDFDAFASTVRDVDSTMMIQKPKYYSWSIYQVKLGEIDVQLGQLGSGNIIEGQSWSNGYLIYLPINQRCSYSVNGEFLDKYSFMILEPGCEFCLSSKAEHDWCSIFVPTHKLIRDSALVESISKYDNYGARITQPDYHLAKQFLNAIHSIINTASNCFSFESSPAATCAAEEVLKLAPLIIEQQQAGKPKQERRPKLSRKEILCSAKKNKKNTKTNIFLWGNWPQELECPNEPFGEPSTSILA